MKKLLLTLFTATALSACVIPITPTVSPQQHAIQGKWGILNLNGKPVTEKDANVGFSLKDQRFYGSGGCNRYTASYVVEGGKLTIGSAAATMMACPMVVSGSITANSSPPSRPAMSMPRRPS